MRWTLYTQGSWEVGMLMARVTGKIQQVAANQTRRLVREAVRASHQIAIERIVVATFLQCPK